MNQVKEDMLRWNVTYPIDLWWRKKFNVPYGSLVHKQMNMLDMWFEYEQELALKQSPKQEQDKPPYIPGNGDFLIKHNEQLKEIDLSQLTSLSQFERGEDGIIRIQGI